MLKTTSSRLSAFPSRWWRQSSG